jgi:hypothetical protein
VKGKDGLFDKLSSGIDAINPFSDEP